MGAFGIDRYIMSVFIVVFDAMFLRSREHEVKEHIPVPYDNLFQSILSYASRSQSYF